MRQTLKYWKHYRESTGIWKAHSPFVYQFYRNVLKDKKKEPVFAASIFISGSSLKNDSDSVFEENHQSNPKKDDFIFRPKYNRFFYRLIKYFEIKTFLEIGESFLPFINVEPLNAAAEKGVEFLSVEKDTGENIPLKSLLRIKNDRYLEKVIEKQGLPEMIYVEEPCEAAEVLLSFEKISSYCEPHTILVFGGIHHTLSMEKAWEAVQNNEKVTFTLDLFYLGLVFFKKEFKEKQHFKLRY